MIYSMNKNNFKKLDNLIEINWLLIFFLLPVFFTTFVYNVWPINKSVLFQVLVEIMFFLFLFKFLIGLKNLREVKNIFYSLKFIFPALLFIFILFIPLIFSGSHYAFWGYYSRKMGYLTWLHFFLFFLVLFFSLKTKNQIKRIFYVIILSSVLIIGYGLLQFLGLDFFSWSEPSFITKRVFSTTGQPNFLGSWLLFALPVLGWAIYHFSVKKNKLLRPLCFCLLILGLLVFILTQSRGAWIGAFLGIFFFLVLFFSFKKKKQYVYSSLVIFFIFIFLFLFLNLSSLEINKTDSVFIKRVKSLSQIKKAGEIRFIWWKHSIDLIKKKPVLGYGLESQHNIFAKYYQPEYAVLEAINLMPDRAHNDFLDIGLSAGLIGLLSYIFLLAYVFIKGIKKVFKSIDNEEKIILLVLLTGLFAYLISLQFSFHIILTGAYFWAFLAMILRISYGFKNI